MMKKLLMTIVTATLISSCESSGQGSNGENRAALDPAVIQQAVDGVIVPTYEDLALKTASLHQSILKLESENNAENFNSAQQAWIAARAPWEKSEGFLFGPVDSEGYDPALDSWPVSQTDLNLILGEKTEFGRDFIQSLEGDKKGFHTIEFLLFGVNRSKSFDKLTTVEINYLIGLSENLNQTAIGLYKSWTEGVNGKTPYREVFVTAGQGSQAYPSITVAAQELIYGMIGIADEVANGKIADPLDAQDQTLVESQYAFNSLTDFQNNLISLRNIYFGSYDGQIHDNSLSRHLESQNEELDATLKLEIQAALDALLVIPEPFRDSVMNPSEKAKIVRAQEAIRQVQKTLEEQVLSYF